MTKSDKKKTKTYSDVSWDEKLIKEHTIDSLFEDCFPNNSDNKEPLSDEMFYCYFIKTNDSENKLNKIEEKKISKERLIQTKKRIDDLK